MVGNGEKVDGEEPIASAVENLRLTRDGVYQIDLDSLLGGNPLVIKVDEGIYRLDFSDFPKLTL